MPARFLLEPRNPNEKPCRNHPWRIGLILAAAGEETAQIVVRLSDDLISHTRWDGPQIQTKRCSDLSYLNRLSGIKLRVGH